MNVLKKYAKQIIVGMLMVVAFAWVVYSQVILAIVSVIPPGTCYESDGGFNVRAGGHIIGTFGLNTSNGTIIFSGVFNDACAPPRGNSTNSTAVIELVCGQNIAPQYSGLAGAILTPCPTGGGLQGRCINQTGYCI